MKVTVLVGAAALLCLAAPVVAAPLAITKPVGATLVGSGAVQTVHLIHRFCQLAPNYGWHRHNKTGSFVPCRPGSFTGR
jgi:hypothetical protein